MSWAFFLIALKKIIDIFKRLKQYFSKVWCISYMYCT